MQPMRLRVELAFPHRTGPAKFWWRPQDAPTVGDLLDELGQELSLPSWDVPRLEATLDGYAVLRGTRPDLLRDGDTLVLSLSRKRGAAATPEGAGLAQAKRQKRLPEAPAVPPPASTSSEETSSEESSSSDDDASPSTSTSKDSSSSSSSGEEEGGGAAAPPDTHQHHQTPAPAQPVAAGSEGKKPSRSARRKAAKRRLRRMGVLPQGGRRRTENGGDVAAGGHDPAPEADQPAAQQPQEVEPPAEQQRQARTEGGRQRAQQGSEVPEVRVPPEWRDAGVQEQPRRAQHQRSQPQRQRQRQQPEQQQQREQQQQPGGHGLAVAAPGPLSEAAFCALPPLEGVPRMGAVLAYRLLEIGLDRLPGVSEPRCGRVVGVDGASAAVTLEPHPDPETHPLAWRRAQAAARRRAEAEAAGLEEEEEESEEEEEPGSLYDERGVLSAELSAFVEVRVVEQAAAGPHAAPQPADHPLAPTAADAQAAAAPASNGTAAGAGAKEGRELSPASCPALGPPRPAAARGDVILPEGGWAALYQQLRERRQQLAQGAAGHAATATPPPPAAKQPAPTGARSAPPAERASNGGRTVGARGSSLTPGATRPRAGVRRTALGPMLSMLRDAQELA